MIPLTFSAPGETFAKAYEDALRYAVWLAHVSDNLMLQRYALDDSNPDAGISIVQTWKNAKYQDNLIMLRQCVIAHAFDDSIFAFQTSQRGRLTIRIGVEHLFPYDTSHSDNDVDDTEETANAVAQRSFLILMRGTLYMPEQETNEGKLVNPFATPRYTAENAPTPDLIGAYDQNRIKILNEKAPKMARRTYRVTRHEVETRRFPDSGLSSKAISRRC